MTPDRWQQINNLFQAVVALQPERRGAFLDEACSTDEMLRSEVETLLASDESGWELLEQPALEVAAPLLADEQPQLLPGQHLSHYEIIKMIGRGGMGEVYLAKDRMLNRKVALKLLPLDYTRDENRLRRFQQEAQAASALNHPNILTIHETSHFQNRQFITTEFVDGETLRQRMKRDPLTLHESLDIAIQTCSALAAAHDAGIIHRDIKPDNIMLRHDGYVKVLDFGLAKLTEQRELATRGEAVGSVDVSSGLLMGTVRYMSPEQAQGLSVDTRSDIFSVGVVLYQMLTRETPFKGHDTRALVRSVLKDDPQPLESLADIPEELQRVVSKALRKDKTQRYQTARELLVDLKALTTLDRSSTQPQQTPVASHATHQRVSTIGSVVSQIRGYRPFAMFGVVSLAVLLLAFAAVAFLYRTRPRSAAIPAMRIRMLTNNGRVNGAAISPDGKKVVYRLTENGESSLWLKELFTGKDVQILPAAKAQYRGLTFSRDGNYIYFINGEGSDLRGVLYKIAVYGPGAPTRLIAEVDSDDIALSPDGNRLAFIRRNRAQGETALMVASGDGATEEKLSVRKMPGSLLHPAWSPDGRTIVCSAYSPENGYPEHHCNVVEVRVADGVERPLSSIWWRFIGPVAWLADGDGLLVIASERAELPLQIWRVSYPDGEASEFTHDTSYYQGISLTADSSYLVATQSQHPFSIWTVVLNGSGDQARQITSGSNKSDGDLGVSWTPAGQIVYETNVNQNFDIWLMDADGGNRKRLTTDTHADANPTVSPDGHYVLFVSERTGTRNVWRMNLDGSDQRQLSGGRMDNFPQCSPDGKRIVYINSDSGKGVVRKISIEGGESTQLTDKDAQMPAVSPDGKLIAFFFLDQHVGPPQWKIGIIPFTGGEVLRTFDLPESISILPQESGIRWMPDGRTLIYIGNQGDISNVWGQPLDGSMPKQLTNFKVDRIFSFDLSRDGSHLVLARMSESYDAVLISDFR